MKQPILAVVTDAHNCHAMTEELIDAWWNSLAPADKARIYEASLADDEDLTDWAEARLRGGLIPQPQHVV